MRGIYHYLVMCAAAGWLAFFALRLRRRRRREFVGRQQGAKRKVSSSPKNFSFRRPLRPLRQTYPLAHPSIHLFIHSAAAMEEEDFFDEMLAMEQEMAAEAEEAAARLAVAQVSASALRSLIMTS